jgi:hypothetical protein
MWKLTLGYGTMNFFEFCVWIWHVIMSYLSCRRSYAWKNNVLVKMQCIKKIKFVNDKHSIAWIYILLDWQRLYDLYVSIDERIACKTCKMHLTMCVKSDHKHNKIFTSSFTYLEHCSTRNCNVQVELQFLIVKVWFVD